MCLKMHHVNVESFKKKKSRICFQISYILVTLLDKVDSKTECTRTLQTSIHISTKKAVYTSIVVAKGDYS